MEKTTIGTALLLLGIISFVIVQIPNIVTLTLLLLGAGLIVHDTWFSSK